MQMSVHCHCDDLPCTRIGFVLGSSSLVEVLKEIVTVFSIRYSDCHSHNLSWKEVDSNGMSLLFGGDYVEYIRFFFRHL